MNKVLLFPKQNAKKAISLQRKEGQKFALIVSMMSLVLVAIFANEQMTQNQREIYVISDNATGIEKLNRAIASAQPVTLYRDLEWERQLARRLNASALSRLPSSSTARVDMIDQLRFGELRGKYRLVQDNHSGKGLVQEIEYVESSEVSDHPILFKDKKAFLEQYKNILAVDFSKIELDQSQAADKNNQEEVYKLLNANKRKVGQAFVKTDTEGRLLSVRLSSIEK